VSLPDLVTSWQSGGETATATTTHNGAETRAEQVARHEAFVAWLKLPENYPED